MNWKKNKSPFKIPKGYFDDFSKKIETDSYIRKFNYSFKTPKKYFEKYQFNLILKKSPINKIKWLPYFQVAASIAFLIGAWSLNEYYLQNINIVNSDIDFYFEEKIENISTNDLIIHINNDQTLYSIEYNNDPVSLRKNYEENNYNNRVFNLIYYEEK
tara:strand:+ start:2400 stop:2873 length:474 start_codon:yes stop_codon:yes gene_type:complete